MTARAHKRGVRVVPFLVCALLALGLASCGDGDGDGTSSDPGAWNMPDEFTAVLGKFVGDRTAAVRGSDGRFHLVYELWLTNGKGVPARVKRIDAIDAGRDRVVGMLRRGHLRAAAHELSGEPAGDTALAPNESVLIYVSLAFDTLEDAPERLVHRIVGSGAASPGSRGPEPIDYRLAPWDVATKRPPTIAAPLAGEGWVATNGCCTSLGAHRGAVQTVDGTLQDSQRFAIDWVRLGPDGRLLGDGDPSDPSTWNAYGAPVHAVGDGEVVEVQDGLKDGVPGALPDPRELTIETVDGNHIVLDLGNGIYAFYAHLRPGSIEVEEGDSVTTGQRLAQIGNTGNTNAPHLHLHLMNRPSAIAADGIPYVFEDFELVGRIALRQWYGNDGPLTRPWNVIAADGGADERTEQLPLDLRIVAFPEQG